MHLVFECLELQCLREQWPHLFEGPQTMQAFMWQYDLIGVAKYTNACVPKRTLRIEQSDQPGGHNHPLDISPSVFEACTVRIMR